MKTYRFFLLVTTVIAACSDGAETTSESNPFYAHDAGTQDAPLPEDSGSPTDPTPDAGTDAPGCFVDDVCGGCMNAVRLPAKGEGDVLVVCSECDGDLCADTMGDCGAYGDACDAEGLPGICIGCCVGIDGHLRCSPLQQ